jgi:multiple sugar transport system permease protein
LNPIRLQRPGITQGLYYAMLGILAIPFLLPLFWMVSTAFKPAAQIYSASIHWLPAPPTFENFERAWGLLDFPGFIRNSLLVTALSVLGTLVSSSLAGYAFATLPGRGKGLLFAALIGTILVPPTVTWIPLFVLFSRLGWVNTYLPLVVPAFFANAFYAFLFRQYFRSLPDELFQSAEIDGCNPWTAYWRIALPLSKPAVATVAIFSFIGSWNDFIGPLLYLNTTSKFTVSLGLSLFHGLYYSQLEYLMPMSLVALLPVLVLFIFAQKYFVAGIVTQ